MSTRSTTLTMLGLCLPTESTSCWRSWRSLYKSRRAMLSHYFFWGEDISLSNTIRTQGDEKEEPCEGDLGAWRWRLGLWPYSQRGSRGSVRPPTLSGSP